MVKFQAIVNGEIVAEGNTLQEVMASAGKQGYSSAEIKVKSVRETPRV